MTSRLLSLLSAIRVGGLLIAVLSTQIFSMLAYKVLQKESFLFDTEILLAVRRAHNLLLDQFMIGITFLGQLDVVPFICSGLVIWLLVGRRRSEATTLTIATVGAEGLIDVLKSMFGRARPELWERILQVGNSSFPSGHALISIVVYGMIGYLLANRFRKWRGVIISLTIVLINLIGLSRLYLGVHWPTDIIGGYTAGFVWLIACILALEVWRELRSPASAAGDKSMLSE